MAKVLKDFDWGTNGDGGTKVSIDEKWFDGNTYVLVQGEDFEGELKNARSTIQGAYTKRGEPNPTPGYEGVVTVLDTRTDSKAGTITMRAVRVPVDDERGQHLLNRRNGMRKADTTEASDS